MWMEITRSDYERRGGRYASDLSDREWALLTPFMPTRKKTRRPRTTEMRDCHGCDPVYGLDGLPMGRCGRMTFHRARRCNAISTIGAGK